MKSQQQLVCEVCGGTEFYTNHDHQLVCHECAFISQTHMSQEASQMDYEDVVAHGAKTRTGTLRTKKKRTVRQYFIDDEGRTRMEYWRTRTPLETYDTSVPFPSLEQCIDGFQQILIYSAEQLVKLLYWDNEEQGPTRRKAVPNRLSRSVFRKRLLNTVRDLWMSYLQAWSDGAEYYAKRYPMVRFSLRDNFFHHFHKQMIWNTLAYQAEQKAKEELRNEREKLRQATRTETYNTDVRIKRELGTEDTDLPQSDDNDDDDSTSNNDEEASKKRKIPPNDLKKPNKSHPPPNATIQHVVQRHTRGRRMNNMEMALVLSGPSMTMAASILWLAVYQTGVASYQMCRWIANGQLPFLNCFHVLSEELQQKLSPIQYFFRMDPPIVPAILETHTEHLAAVCRLLAKDELVYQRPHNKDRNLRFVTVDNIPIITAQIVADLQLGQDVMDASMHIMGLRKVRREDSSAQKRLPNPIDAASPDKLVTMAHVLAVIAMACFIQPDWRRWQVVTRPVTDKPRHGGYGIPYNEEQLNAFVTNGPAMEGYMDFLEQYILRDGEDVSPEIAELLSFHETSRRKASYDDSDSDSLDEEVDEFDDKNLSSNLPPRPVCGVQTKSFYNKQDATKNAPTGKPIKELPDEQMRMFLGFLEYSTHSVPGSVEPILLEMVPARLRDRYGWIVREHVQRDAKNKITASLRQN